MKNLITLFITFFLINISSIFATNLSSHNSEASFHFEEVTCLDNHGTSNHFSHLVLKLVPEGYPTNKTLEFRVHRSALNTFDVYYLLIKDDGSIVSLNDDFFKEEKPFLVIFCTPLLGENIFCSLSMLGNNFYDSYLNFNPYPIEMSDDWGHKIVLTLSDAEKGDFYYSGEGFKHFEDIQIKTSYGPSEETLFTKSYSGRYEGKLSNLFKDGYKYGFVQIEFLGENLDMNFYIPQDLSNKNFWHWGNNQKYLTDEDL